MSWRPPSQGPPPLRKRSSHSRESSRSQGEKEGDLHVDQEPQLLPRSPKPEGIGEDVSELPKTKTEGELQLPFAGIGIITYTR